MANNNIKVAIKVRPLIARERRDKIEEQWTVTENSIVSLNPLHTSTYHFDHVFGKDATNQDVFSTIAHPIVKQSLEGFNGTIFAYGQTSSGKTHTMLGNDKDPGITAMAVRQLFEENESDRTFMIRVGYIEIYNEKVYDLLKKREAVSISQNGDNDVKLTNKEVIVQDGETILNILAVGNKLRKAAQTSMNDASSRSHAIFRIVIESEDSTGNGPVRVSYLNLVDLAGSEKANDAGTSGTRLKEGNDINKSLLHLGMAIRALSEGKKFVDFRSSKLTRILQASLGGNANTAIICNITPAAMEETASTLGFANQAKTVKNDARLNEVYTPDEAIMKQMQNEVVRLKTELEKSTETERALRSEIAQKEAIFLSGKDMRVIKVDRRKTWHHMPGENSQPLSKIPQAQPKTGSMDGTPSLMRPQAQPKTGSMDGTRPLMRPNFVNTPKSSLLSTSTLSPLNLPRELKDQVADTPSPVRATLKYQLGKVEREYSDLKQFTALETRLDVYADVDVIRKLEMDLKLAREEIERYKEMKLESIDEPGNSNGMIEPESNGEPSTENSVMSNELQAANDRIDELIQQIDELRSIHDKEKESLDQKLKVAKNAREKAEVLQAEGEITFGQYKKQTNRRIDELISEIEFLKTNSTTAKHVDLNISKMPIRVEAEDCYERTEMKFEMEQLKHEQERNKKTMEALEAKLKSVIDERDTLKSENVKVSARSEEVVKEMESQMKEIVEEKNALQQTLQAKRIEDLESQIKTLTEEKSAIESERSGLSESHNKIVTDLEQQLQTAKEEIRAIHQGNEKILAERNKVVGDLESQLETLQSEKSDLSTQHEQLVNNLLSQLDTLQSENAEMAARHSDVVKKLEIQLQEVTDEKIALELNQPEPGCDIEAMEFAEKQVKILIEDRNALQSKCSELAASTNKTIKDLETQLEALVEEKNALQVEHSDLSTQVMDYIEEVDEMKTKLDSSQAKFDDLQKIYDDNLHVIEKTEEECRTFKASLLESYEKIKISMEETESLKTELQDKQQLADNLNAENSALVTEVSNLKNSLNTQLNEMNVLSQKNRELQQQNEMLRSDVADGNSLQEHIEQLQKTHREDIAEMEEFYKKLTEQFKADILNLNVELGQKKQLADQTAATFKAERVTLEESLRKKQEQLEHLNATIAKLQSDANVMEQQLRRFEEDLKIATDELSEKQNQIANYETVIRDLKTESGEKSQTELSKMRDELQEKVQLVLSRDSVIAGLQSKIQNELEEKQQLVVSHETVVSDLRSKFEIELLELKTALQEKEELFDSKTTSEGELAELKVKLQEKHHDLVKHNEIISDLKAKLQKELDEKQQLLDSHDTVVNDLKGKLQSEQEAKQQFVHSHDSVLSDLKEKLEEKRQHVRGQDIALRELEEKLQKQIEEKEQLVRSHDDALMKLEFKLQKELEEKEQLVVGHDAAISDLKTKLQNELEGQRKLAKKLQCELKGKEEIVRGHDTALMELKAKLQSELEEKQQLARTYNAAISDLKSKLENVVEEKQKLLDIHSTAIIDLNSNLNEKFQSELTAKLQEKEQQHEIELSDLQSKFHTEIVDLKATLQVKEEQIASNENIVAKLQSELNEKDNNALSAKHIIESLQTQLECREPVEPKRTSPKCNKVNPNADRKARRYSKHDESRLWLDDTVVPPRSVETQTDPSSDSCACESMNTKIMELKRQLAIKTSVANTLRLEMENHPLISKNKDLKKELDDKKTEVELLQMELDHYEKKLHLERKRRECPCLTRQTENKEVQVDSTNSPNGELSMPNGIANGLNGSAKNGHAGDSNGDNRYVETPFQRPNFEHLSENMKNYYAQILPVKYTDAMKQIRSLKENYDQLLKKTNVYKDVALSRRADIKKLEAKLAASTQNNGENGPAHVDNV